MHRYSALAVVFVCLACGSGCVSGSHKLQLTESYFMEKNVSVGEKLSGTGAVYTTRDNDVYVYKGGAASWIGRAAQFEIPIGAMTKEIAEKVMTKKFSGGCAMTNSKRAAAKYRVTMHPRITAYEYKIRMALAGFNLVSQVEMTLSLDLLNRQQKVIFSKKYRSGLVSGESFWGSIRGAEAVNKITHETIFNLMQKAARDLEDILAELR